MLKFIVNTLVLFYIIYLLLIFPIELIRRFIKFKKIYFIPTYLRIPFKSYSLTADDSLDRIFVQFYIFTNYRSNTSKNLIFIYYKRIRIKHHLKKYYTSPVLNIAIYYILFHILRISGISASP